MINMVKCPNCGQDIPDDEVLLVTGVAYVTGRASIREFHDEGVTWTPHDSWDEEFECPHCGDFFAPDFAELRKKWA